MNAPSFRSGADASREKEKAEGERKRAVVRTMRSDVAAALKTAKPALLELGVKSEPSGRGGRTPLVLKILGMGIILGVFAVGGFLSYRTLTLAPPPAPALPPPAPPPPPTPPAFIFFESAEETTILQARHELERALDAERAVGLPGEFHRIVIRIPDAAGARSVMTAREFFMLLASSPPDGFLTLFPDPPQFFVHRGAESAPALGMLFRASDPAEAFRVVAAWEPRMTDELAALFTARTATTAPAFADASYRNIPYRFRALDPVERRGIGYFGFPARSLVVFAATEETLQHTIDRIFENR